MKLFINGNIVDVPETTKTVFNLLEYFKLEQKVVIIELNEIILDKDAHKETLLSDKDKIEIVNFVGGG